MNTAPPIKKPQGSFFPELPRHGCYGYSVETVNGEVIYYGNSEYVARLLIACLTPRTS